MPVGFRIASAWVDIRAESKGLRQEIKSAVEAAAKGQHAKVELKINTKGLRKEVQTALNNATKGMKPKVEIGIASKGLRAEVTAALKKATEKQKPTVKLGISSTGLRGEVQRALAAATKDQKPNVRLGISSKGLSAEVRAAIAAATAGQAAEVPLRIDNRAFANSLNRAVNNAARNSRAQVRVDADGEHFLRSIQKAVADSKSKLSVDVDEAAFRRSIMNAADDEEIRVRATAFFNAQTFRRTLNRLAQNQPVQINGQVNVNSLQRSLNQRVNARNGLNTTVNTNVNVNRLRAQLTAAGRTAARTTPSVGIRTHLNTNGFQRGAQNMSRLTKIVLASVIFIPPALAVVDTALRAIGPSSAVAVSGLVALTTVGATLAVGMNNVVNAITASSISLDKYYGFLDQLTPAARSFVETVVNSKGAWKEFQAVIQETLFNELDKEMSHLATQTIPTFTVGLGGMAMILNGMAKESFKTTVAMAKMGDLDRMFGGLHLAMKPLVPVPGQILNGIVKLGTAAMPVFIRMNTAMGNWFDTMTIKLNRAFADGRLQAAITQSADDIVNWFRRIANNPEFEQFMAHMKATGPEMSEALGHITEALAKLINNLSPIAGAIIKVANAFAQLIIALPDDVIKILLSMVVAFKLIGLAHSGIVRTAAAMTTLSTAMTGVAAQNSVMAVAGARLRTLGASAGAILRSANAVGMLARAGLLLGGIALVAWGVHSAMSAAFGDAPVNVNKLTKSLVDFNKTGRLSGEAARVFGANWVQQVDGADKKMGGLREAIKGIAHPGTWDRIFNGFQKATNWLDPGKTKLEEYKEKIGGVDKALAKLVKDGHMDTANSLFGKLAAEARKSGTSTEKFQTLLPKYTEALKAAKKAQKEAAETMGVFGQQAMDVADRIKTLNAEAQGLVKSLFEMNNVNRESINASKNWEESADAIDKFVKANKKKAVGLHYVNGELTQNNELQREAATLLDTHAQNTEKSALAVFTATGSWDKANAKMTEGRKKIIDAAIAFGMSKTEAENYANAIIKIPTQKELHLMIAGQAEEQLLKVSAAFRAQPDKKTITVTTLNTSAIKALEDLGYKVRELPDGKFQITADKKPAEDDLEAIEGYKINPKTVEILAKITSATLEIDELQTRVDELKQKKPSELKADGGKLQKELDAKQKKIDDLKQKRAVELKALDKTGPGVDSAKKTMDKLKDKKVTVTVTSVLAGPDPGDIADAIRKQAEAQARAAKGKWTGGKVSRFATGGYARGGAPGFVSGPGGPKSDKIAALLSNGEYVVRASSVSKYGMAMMNAINQGRWPRFAEGGAVSGAGGGSAGSNVSAGVTTGTFTVKDGTGKPVASAVQNFKALRTALGLTYTDMGQKTTQFNTQFQTKTGATYKAVAAAVTQFGRQQVGRTNTTRTQTLNAWNQWKSGMTSRTNTTYKALGSQASAFQRTATTRTTQTKNTTQGVWNSWGKGMESRTTQTYGRINTATSSFSKQSISKMGGARDGMGAAWGGLSPKFKPPVSYLIHTVINKGVVGSMNAIMTKLGGGKKIGGIGVAGFATGGPVYGAGTKTSDSIPARLSNGEFVMQAKAVDKFGVGFFNQLNRGTMPKDGAGFPRGFSMGGGVNINMPGFATGGAVGVPSADALNKIIGDGDGPGVKRMTDFIMNEFVLPLIDSGSGGSAMKDVQRQGMAHIRGNIEAFVKENFGGAGSAAAGLRWAKTQHGKPYQWGGNGNPSWDCSGFMSAIESVIRGEKPHRRWSTHAFNGGTPPGWKAGANRPFKVGITHAGVGHTAGTVGKTNVESAGGGAGVRVGSSARGYNNGMFTSWYGYVGPNATKAATGGLIRGKGTGTSDSIPAWLSNGEFVIRAAAAKKLGSAYLHALNSGNMPRFGAGGKVTTTSSGTQYKIVSGDTLSEIAAKFGTTVSALMKLNTTIKNANKIYAGQTIWLKKAAGGGSGGGSSSPKPPGFSLPGMYKVGKSGIQSKEGIGTLKGIVTLSQASIEANKAGANIKTEIISALTKAETSGELMSNIYELQGQIKAAFKGKAETDMLSRLNTVTKALTPLQKSLTDITGKLDKAKDALEDLKGKFDSMKESVSENIMEFGSITKIGKWGTNPQTLLDQLQKDVGKADQFGDMLAQLKAKGINSDVIGQIAEAGITGGGMSTAASLLQMTPEQIAKLNALQLQLTAEANKAGNVAADAMYGAGIKAAEGLVKGLEAQQTAIEAQMMKIAQAMEKAIKQALGIKSPSRVMMKVADFTADGLVNQLIARKVDAERAMATLVAPTTGPAPVSAVGTIGSGSRGSVVHIENINVCVSGTFELNNPAERKNLAKALAKDIKEEIRRDDKKHR